MAAPYASGDVLAMRRFAGSSLGAAYTTVWHRTPEGVWTIYSNRPPMETCPRYFGSALARAIETPIAVRWRAPTVMDVDVPAAALAWTVELAQTPTTRFLNGVSRRMSDRMWRRPRLLALVARVAARLLHAGKLGLAGVAPNGQTFIANPMNLWLIHASRATIAGRDLGALAPLPEQTRLGDFWIPQRPLFAFGRAFFEPFDATRHLAVTQQLGDVRASPPPAPPAHA